MMIEIMDGFDAADGSYRPRVIRIENPAPALYDAFALARWRAWADWNVLLQGRGSGDAAGYGFGATRDPAAPDAMVEALQDRVQGASD